MNKSNLAYKAPDPQGQVVRFPKKERQVMSKKEEGYTKLTNSLIDDQIMAQLNDKAFKCLIFIMRQTAGFDRISHTIAITQFQKYCGIKKRDTVMSCIKTLEDLKLIRVERKMGVLNDYFYTPNQYHQTVLVPSNGTSTVKRDGSSPTKGDYTSPIKRDTIKETLKENSKEREEEEAHGENQKFTAQKRQLSFVEYHVSDRTPISLRDLFRKYPAQVDFIDQAKISFPNHTVDQIFSELQKMGQWSLSSSNHMPQKWMSIWLGFMQKVPTAAEQAAAQMRKAKSKPTQKTEKKYHQYGQVPVTPSIQDVGGNHE